MKIALGFLAETGQSKGLRDGRSECQAYTAIGVQLSTLSTTVGDLSEKAKMNGTIKRMVSDKGFGFIAAEDGSEYFFHQSACTPGAVRPAA